jgi:hypothetical protein
MADETKQKIVEWKSDPLRPRMVWEGEEEVYDGAIVAECPEAGEIAVHVTRNGADSPVSSLYMSPAEAVLLAERIKTAAWIAEKLAAPNA